MFTDKLFAPHPSKLQETSALANATPLPHDYKLHLPLRTVKDCLTAAQLETSTPPSLWVLSPLSTPGIVGHIALSMICGKYLQDREVSIMCRPCPCPSSFARLEGKVTCL